MSDMSKSFTYLQETIPQWLQDIANIEQKISSMQDEIARVSVSQSPFVKGRTGSIDSIRPDKLDVVAEENTPSNTTRSPANPLGSRKRKSPSVSSGPSGPTKYRPRTMVVVSYDGDMQKSFELLVRGLAMGRNMLRKAKMEAKMAELAAIAGSSEDEDDHEEEEENIMSKISYRPRMTSMRVRAAAARRGRNGLSGAPIPPVELFETTDKTLEQAQELCEKSAHLSLREGDCRTELKLARTNLENVLTTAKTEVTKCNASQPQRMQALQDQETSDTPISSTEPSYKRHFPSISAPKPAPEPEAKLEPVTAQSTIHAPVTTTVAAPKTMDIEVDDDDEDEDMDFVMPPVRFTSRRAARA
ncbi:hypothetical protein EKO04_007394 [Ascochyta lentis]|uniref:Uncharacterized protein n=1 Tax=Ascochyta lentis TaxID=205686 RepID=A0A8H7J315_9PLEO|nr:hypothetical protein EKO04_007394 [Ascochyta lentis]